MKQLDPSTRIECLIKHQPCDSFMTYHFYGIPLLWKEGSGMAAHSVGDDTVAVRHISLMHRKLLNTNSCTECIKVYMDSPESSCKAKSPSCLLDRYIAYIFCALIPNPLIERMKLISNHDIEHTWDWKGLRLPKIRGTDWNPTWICHFPPFRGS